MTHRLVEPAVNICLSVLPVVLFLLALVILDSYKLVTLRAVVVAVALGAAAALACYAVNRVLLATSPVDHTAFVRYVAPLIEETAKGLILIYLLLRGRIGFLADAAIFGFAIGTGFAVVENIYYLQAATEASAFTWLIRGFGTGIMHGAAASLLALVMLVLLERSRRMRAWYFLPGLLTAYVIHSVYNHFLLTPAITAAVTIVLLPPFFVFVFSKSEQLTGRWLGVGFDTDQELLHLLTSGQLSDSPVGVYLQSLRERFTPTTVADMLCWLRVRLELSIHAKGLIMMRKAGFDPPPADDVRAKLAELDYLERSIGATGLSVVSPLVSFGTRDTWQFDLLGDARR